MPATPPITHPSETAVWPLDPEVVFLNHGSFGSCPRPVREFQRAMRERLERQPIKFLGRELEGLLDAARAELAAFVGAQADDLVFVHNATEGVNTVLRATPFSPGDELLITDHAYGACRAAAMFAAEQAGATVVVAHVPFPVKSPDEIVESVLARVTIRTRLALMDHITSPTALILPIERLVCKLAGRGVDTLVDGAHAPGMVPLQLDSLGAAFYTGNCHKWLCGPKGAAFLHVRHDRQARVRPLTVSMGSGPARPGRSRFVADFHWTGTRDPSAWLAVPEAIRAVAALVPGGWPEVMSRNHALALEGRKLLCDSLGTSLPCPDAFIGSMAAVPLPDAQTAATADTPPVPDTLYAQLLAHGIEVPVCGWPAPPKRHVRISAQLYNTVAHYAALAAALKNSLPPTDGQP